MSDLASKLDGLRRSLPGCRLVAYGDLQHELVLLSASEERRPREYLDEVGAEAARLFQALETADLAAGGNGLSDAGLTVLLPGEVRMYMSGAEADFLCLVSDTPANSIASADASSRFLSRLGRYDDD